MAAAKKATAFELYTKLFEPFPDEVKETKRFGGKGEITYVEWYHYIARAWKDFPEGFTTEIMKLATIGDHLIMVVRVTDVGSGIYHESTGSAKADKSSDNFGGAAAEAEAQALKRAFAKFGLGLEMYMDEEDQEQADPDSVTSSMTKSQIARMKQLVACIPGGDEFDDVREFVKAERLAVKAVTDKKWRCDLAIEGLIKNLESFEIEIPDPS